ncbi:MAG: 30S ribosomal protein S6 [Opitutaceae bacterium]|nr:30S ribosomal protein S6 [Opitutaceae bacterium]|tara:strand:- start:12844 stop:13137 length:294 start_codon:yes stop_codon:yes gene_type:complete
MTLTKRTYKTTLVLDTRDQEKSPSELLEDVKTVLATLDANVTREEDLGKRDFVRVTDRNFTAGQYFELTIEAPTNFAQDVQEKFRLDKVVYRIIVQS